MTDTTAEKPRRYGLVIALDRCTGCYNCFLACRDEHAGIDRRPVALAQPDGQAWIAIREHERGSGSKVRLSHVPVPCLHCADAPCMRAASDGAVYRRADGIVIIDPDKSAGQRAIVAACPYGVVFWNEARNVPQKCTLCAHLLDDGWREPRCVEACPTQALVFGDLADPHSDVTRLAAGADIETLPPSVGAPAVVYRGLPKPFLAGEVVLADRPGECAEGVAVTLLAGSSSLQARTDNYGDFAFEGLGAETEYVLTIECPGYRAHSRSVRTGGDPNLGTIVLQAAA